MPAAETVRFVRPSDAGDLGNLLVDRAIGVQQVLARRVLIEHGLAHLDIATVTLEALLGSVVDAGGPQCAEEVADGTDHLLVGRSVGEPSARLPEGIMVVDERDEVAAEL